MAIFVFFFKMVAAAMLNLQNMEILGLGLRRLKYATMPNFALTGQTVTEIWRFFDLAKTAAIRHLGFVMSVFGPPTKGIWWSLSLCTILSESMQQF